MRYLFGFLAVCALSAVPLVGCSEDGGEGGSGGMAGTGGEGGNGVACQDNVCPCTEAGIRAAIAEGVGPFTFDCDGPQTVVTEAEIVIDSNVILQDNGNLTLDGNDEHPVLSVLGGVTVELRGFMVTKGRAPDGRAGGIINFGTLTLTNSTVSGNDEGDPGVGPSSGGILNGGTLTLTDSTVSGNTGLGILTAHGTLTLNNSTVSGNTNDGILNLEGTVALTNSTVSGNTSLGIRNSDGTLALTNSTVSGNAIAGIFSQRGTTTLTGTIIDGDCGGTMTSGGHNIESPGDTCGFDQTGDQSGVSAVELDLQPLADNGGPTQTRAITTGSAAFNTGGACEVETDQRGVARPQGPACDVGAFELEQP